MTMWTHAAGVKKRTDGHMNPECENVSENFRELGKESVKKRCDRI